MGEPQESDLAIQMLYRSTPNILFAHGDVPGINLDPVNVFHWKEDAQILFYEGKAFRREEDAQMWFYESSSHSGLLAYINSAVPDVLGNDLGPDIVHCVEEATPDWAHEKAWKPWKYRTEMCWYGDKCTRSRCLFAHTLGELRSKVLHPKYRTEPCRYYLSNEVCPHYVKGRCSFSHAKPGDYGRIPTARKDD